MMRTLEHQMLTTLTKKLRMMTEKTVAQAVVLPGTFALHG